MRIDHESRREAKEIMVSGNDDLGYSFEKVPMEPDTFETRQFLDELKPLHYARLAQTIDLLLERTLSQSDSRPPQGLIRSRTILGEPWMQLRADYLHTVRKDTEFIKDTPTFQRTSDITKLIGALDEKRFNDLETQLWAGSETAINHMLIVLANLPSIIAYHSHGSEVNYAQVAARSFGLVQQIAMGSINQLESSRAALRGEIDPAWSIPESKLMPELFKVITNGLRVTAVKFKDLEDARVPEGFQMYSWVEPNEEEIRLGDVESYHAITIGCPATLIGGRLFELWSFFIDVVDKSDMWTVDFGQIKKRYEAGLDKIEDEEAN